MGHIHKVYDTDIHFKIDAVTRAVKNVSETKVMIVQHDHNSERFTFEIPRYVDGHDMSTCNVVQIHYINTDSAHTNGNHSGIYEVDDLQVSPEDENVVICSWLISGNATQSVGKLSFIVRFVCTSEGNVDYVWNTAVHSNVFVSAGINNSDFIVEQYADVLEQWRNELIESGGVSDERIEQAVEAYFAENPSSGGLSATASGLLIEILRNGVYSTDQSENITALANALGVTEPDAPEPPVEPDEPDIPVVKTYTITNNLTNVTSNNATASVNENASYDAILTASEGYELDSVTVTMGGTDITATAYASGVVTIGAVTGNVVITAVAVEVKEEVIYTLGGKKYGHPEVTWTDESGATIEAITTNGIYFLSNDTFETDTPLAIEFNYTATYTHAIYIGSYDGSALRNVRLFGAVQHIAGTVFTENYTVKSGCQLCVGFGNAVSPTITVKGV